MKAKKSEKANLENKRSTFFLIGLVIALGVVLLAFEWKTTEQEAIPEFVQGNITFEDDLFIPPTTAEQPKPPKPMVKVPNFTIVEDDKLVDDNFDDFSTDPVDLVGIDLDNLVFKPRETDPDDEDEIILLPEIMPEFPGGEQALLNYLANNVKYPVIAQENGIQGRVYVSFVVDESGNIFDVNIVRGVDSSIDNEALRVVRGMPKWKPGRQGGKAVKVRYFVPVKFELR